MKFKEWLQDSGEFFSLFAAPILMVALFVGGVWFYSTHTRDHYLYYCVNHGGVRQLQTMYGQRDYVVCGDSTIEVFTGNSLRNTDMEDRPYYAQ